MIFNTQLHSPPYASALLFELRAHNNVSYVSIFYKNSTGTPEPMFIPDCGISCPLDKTFQLFQNSMPLRDRDEECTVPVAQLSRDEILANSKESTENVRSNANSHLVSFILTTTSCIFVFSLYWFVWFAPHSQIYGNPHCLLHISTLLWLNAGFSYMINIYEFTLLCTERILT